jgi:predicted nucleotidyltransferase
MKKLPPKISQIQKQVIPILKKNGVIKAGIFGSYARGEERKESDIDFLIKFKSGKSLLDLVGLEQELKGKLRKEVDIITYKYINPLLRERILREEIKIL